MLRERIVGERLVNVEVFAALGASVLVRGHANSGRTPVQLRWHSPRVSANATAGPRIPAALGQNGTDALRARTRAPRVVARNLSQRPARRAPPRPRCDGGRVRKSGCLERRPADGLARR